MKEKVAISIFTPVYNRAKTIQATFESLKRQTVKDFEWIVINDGSSDDSEKIIRNFEGGGDSRFTTIIKPIKGSISRKIMLWM